MSVLRNHKQSLTVSRLMKLKAYNKLINRSALTTRFYFYIWLAPGY